MRRIVFLLVFVLPVVVLAQTDTGASTAKSPTGPAKSESASKASSESNTAGTSSARDRQLEAEIRQRLAKSVIGRDGLTARVQAGIIYLEGTTAVGQRKGAATRMAKSVLAKSPGARGYVNNIQVTKSSGRPVIVRAERSAQPSPSGQEASGQRTGSPVSAQAQRSNGSSGSSPAKAIPPPVPGTKPAGNQPVAAQSLPANSVLTPGASGPRRVTVQWK